MPISVGVIILTLLIIYALAKKSNLPYSEPSPAESPPPSLSINDINWFLATHDYSYNDFGLITPEEVTVDLFPQPATGCAWEDPWKPTRKNVRLGASSFSNAEPTAFSPAAKLFFRYRDEEIKHLDENTLTVARCSSNPNPTYRELFPTLVHGKDNFIEANINKPGDFGLLGKLQCPEDDGEIDDDLDSASQFGDKPINIGKRPTIGFGEKFKRILDSREDVDSFGFQGEKGRKYIVEISNLAPGVDPVLISHHYPEGVNYVLENKQAFTIELSFKGNQSSLFTVKPNEKSIVGCAAKYEITVREIK